MADLEVKTIEGVQDTGSPVLDSLVNIVQPRPWASMRKRWALCTTRLWTWRRKSPAVWGPAPTAERYRL